MKVSTEEIRAIPLGASAMFRVEHPKEINTAKALAYRLNSLEEGRRYTCKSDYEKRLLIITANPV